MDREGPFQDRNELRGISDVLDRVAVKYLMARPELGRFFINEQGAFYKDESGVVMQFVESCLVEAAAH